MRRRLRRGWYLLVLLFLAWSLALVVHIETLGQKVAGFSAHIAALEARIGALPPISREQRIRFSDLASRPWRDLTPAEKIGTQGYLDRRSIEEERDLYRHFETLSWRAMLSGQGLLLLNLFLVLVLGAILLPARALWRRVRRNRGARAIDRAQDLAALPLA